MRLTHKHKYKRSSQRFVFDMKDYRKACQKLGQLEDIEEELGIDLITLFKALKQKTLFVKTPTNIRETIEDDEGWAIKAMMHEDGELRIFTNVLYPSGIGKTEWLTPIRLRLSDYGKTWALTRKELENE